MFKFLTYIISISFFLLINNFATAQSDECGTATALTVNPVCSNVTGSTVGFTNSTFDASCFGNDDDDGWYQFTATSTTQTITLTPGGGFDAVITLMSDCTTEIECADNTISTPEVITRSDFVAGNTYYVHVYGYGSGGGTFNICVEGPPSCIPSVTPADDCANAPLIYSLDGFCGSTAGYTIDANPAFCGAINNNSWLRFIASQTTVSIDWWVGGDPVLCDDGVQLELFSGVCGSLVDIAGTCINPTGPSGSSGTWNLSGLTVGDTYYVMIDGYAGDQCDYTFAGTIGIATTSVTPCDNCNDATCNNSGVLADEATANASSGGCTPTEVRAGGGMVTFCTTITTPAVLVEPYLSYAIMTTFAPSSCATFDNRTVTTSCSNVTPLAGYTTAINGRPVFPVTPSTTYELCLTWDATGCSDASNPCVTPFWDAGPAGCNADAGNWQ